MKYLLARALLIMGVVAPLWASDAVAQSGFDGRWLISVTTKSSAGCGVATYPYDISIKGGAITPNSGPSRLSTFFASVDAAGNIGGVIAARRDRSQASGRLRKDGTGSGVWSSLDWGCGGMWTARRVS